MFRLSRPKSGLRVSLLLGVLIGSILVAPPGLAQEGARRPVLRLCLEENNFPVSSRDLGGYDLDIAQLLAESIGADLEVTWTGAQGQYVVETYLLTGQCDFMMSVTEGAGDLLNTVAYYQSNYVFVYRKDAAFEVTSLDDSVLHDLRISTYPNSIPHRALINRGLDDQLEFFVPVAGSRGPDLDTPTLDAIAKGEIDVAILYGPFAGYYATHESQELQVVPVLPQIDAPMLPMYRILTMAVRPGSEALRDELNIAIARRWSEIQGVLEEFGVPTSPLLAPAERERPTDVISVGLILPLPTALGKDTDSAADSARVGARLAENVLAPGGPEGRHRLDIRVDNAPTATTAAEAARRMIAIDSVSAIVGGVGEGQATALREVAEEYGVPFMNIGSAESVLREELCSEFVFHVEASSAMYLDALAYWYTGQGNRTWFVVGDGSDRGQSLMERAVSAISAANPENEVSGTVQVPPGSFDQSEAIEQVVASNADVAVILLSPIEHELFISQLQRESVESEIASFLEPSAQTREALLRRRQAAGGLELGPHFALWDSTLDAEDAADLIQRYTSRSGRPMEPSAWAAYAAVKIVSDTAAQLASTNAAEIAEYLGSGNAQFELGKSVTLTIRPEDHQLVQPLYAVVIDPDAEWGLDLAGRVGLGRVVGQVPEVGEDPGPAMAEMSRLGRTPADLGCSASQ